RTGGERASVPDQIPSSRRVLLTFGSTRAVAIITMRYCMSTTTASKTSSAKRARRRARGSGAKASFIRDIRSVSPTRHTGRKREARRWLDVLAARCTNGPRCPNPITIAEGARLRSQAFGDLEASDKWLSDAVQECPG